LMKAGTRLIQALPANGIYTLVISLSREICLNVGKLGQQRFPKGHYTYTGSALGKGASSLKRRISRHIQKEKRNFWHIDFLLANENATVKVVVVAQTNEKLECNLNSYIGGEERAKILVEGFGASDCRANCGSHLLFYPDITEEPVLVQKIIKCYESLGLAPMHECMRQWGARATKLQKRRLAAERERSS
jgi:Uri superfamily endonuclease